MFPLQTDDDIQGPSYIPVLFPKFLQADTVLWPFLSFYALKKTGNLLKDI